MSDPRPWSEPRGASPRTRSQTRRHRVGRVIHPPISTATVMERNASPLRKGGTKGGRTAPAHGQKIRAWSGSDTTHPSRDREQADHPSRAAQARGHLPRHEGTDQYRDPPRRGAAKCSATARGWRKSREGRSNLAQDLQSWVRDAPYRPSPPPSVGPSRDGQGAVFLRPEGARTLPGTFSPWKASSQKTPPLPTRERVGVRVHRRNCAVIRAARRKPADTSRTAGGNCNVFSEKAARLA